MPVETVIFEPRPRTVPAVDPFVLRVGNDEALVYSYTRIKAPSSEEIKEKQGLGFPMADWELHILFVGWAKEELRKTQSTCYWCDRPITKKTISLEHLVPRSLGGKDVIENCVLACKKCNSRRGTMTPEEFRKSPWLAYLKGQGPRPKNKFRRKRERVGHVSPSTARWLIKVEKRKEARRLRRANRPDKAVSFQTIYMKSKLFV